MPRGIYARTSEHQQKIADANRGKARSIETRQKISESLKGRKAWNKGVHSTPWIVGKKHTPEALQKMSQAKLGNTNRLGKTFTEESKQKMSATKKGKHYSPDTEFKKGQPSWSKGKKRPDMIGNTAGFKKGQIPWNKGLGTKSSENEKARKTKQARDWRKAVFERDNYTCQSYGQHGGILNADHIKQFAYFPELRYDINNGRTLCLDCHRGTSTWGNKKKD